MPFSDSWLVGFSASTNWCSPGRTANSGTLFCSWGQTFSRWNETTRSGQMSFVSGLRSTKCTHRLQFTGVPWLRSYFLGLVEELVAITKPESGQIQRVAAQLREAAAAGEPLIDESGIFGVFATPEQREVIDRVQALMSLLEGHGHVVMDRIGGRELVTQARMSAVLKARRSDKRTAALMRLIGLEMKLLQYEMGERFIKGVEDRASWPTLDLAWESPEALPTLEEIEAPDLWLQRIA